MAALFFALSAGLVFAGENRREISFPVPSDVKPFERIRILVAPNKPEVQITCKAEVEVYDDRGNVVYRGPELSGVTVKPVADGLQWWARTVPSKSLLLKSKGGGIRVGGTGLYGDMILLHKNSKGQLDVINEISVEDYLKGVIPFEANPLWAIESLKAQVVAARSYAFFKMLERVNEPYDVTSGIYSQVYMGKRIENPKTNEAIEATRGEILTYRDKAFPGYFHSTCGGRTTRADLVWNVKKLEPLVGVECKFCKKSPHARWEASFAPAEIKEGMAKKGGIPVREVKSVKLDKIDEAGRAHLILIGSTWGERKVDADAFRIWMGPGKLKSNLITRISFIDGEFVFKGRGWGHGVGMCQYGMKYLGELGYDYHEILGYYYPGAQIMKLPEVAQSS